MAELTDKQQRFCDEYLIDLNATQAAIRAGYSEKTAKEQGYENLTKPHIQEYISERQLAISNKLNINQERVLNEYAKIAFFDIRKLYNDDGSLLPIQDIDSDTAGAISGMESYEEKTQAGEETMVAGVVRKVKIWDKIKALEGLGKHLGIFEKDNSQKITPLAVGTPDQFQQLLNIAKANAAIPGQGE